MGLQQHIAAGANLERVTQTFLTNSSGSGSVSIAPASALLRIRANNTCRLRLYDNQSSLENATEISRPYGNLNIQPSVALVGDFTIGTTQDNFINPVLYSVTENPAGQLYYRISPNTPTEISLTYYTLTDTNVPPTIGTPYTVDNRRTIDILETLPGTTAPVTGTLGVGDVPKTYLLVSASLTDPSHIARLRLYRRSDPLSDATELARPFLSEPSASTQLIVDMVLSGSNDMYFVPKILGANLESMGTNLNLIKGNRASFAGEAEMYYVLQNLTPVGDDVQVSLHVFSLED
jgi:hypothetical protein